MNQILKIYHTPCCDWFMGEVVSFYRNALYYHTEGNVHLNLEETLVLVGGINTNGIHFS